jgi:hypothetical protein
MGMDLEQRMQALEQELAILKNQIQATLLDIREQVLNNSYPALRAENVLAEPDAGAGSASVQQPGASAPIPSHQEVAAAPVPHVVTLSPAQSTPEQVEYEPATHETVLSHPTRVAPAGAPSADEYENGDDRDLFEAANPYSAPAEARGYPSATPVTSTSPHETPVSQPRSARPANGSQADDDTLVFPPVRRVSLNDIREPLSEEDMFIDPSDAPMPFITDDDEPPFVTQTELITEADWAALGQLETWVNCKVREYGATYTKEMIGAYEAEGRFDSKVKKVLLQLVSIIAAEDQTAAPLPDRDRAIQPAVTADHGDHANQPSPRLILKLIAGVQNAGVSTSRRNNHG